MPVGHFPIVSSAVFGPSQRHASFWSFHTTLRRSTRGAGAFRNVLASMRGRRRQLEYGNNVCMFRRRSGPHGDRGGAGNITNDGSKADLIPSSDAAIAAFVDLAAVKWRRYGYQGQKRRLLVLFPFFFFFPRRGPHRSPVSVTPFWLQLCQDPLSGTGLLSGIVLWCSHCGEFNLGNRGAAEEFHSRRWWMSEISDARKSRISSPPSTSCWRCPWSKLSPSLVQLSRKAGGSDVWRRSQGQMKHFKKGFFSCGVFFTLGNKGKEWGVWLAAFFARVRRCYLANLQSAIIYYLHLQICQPGLV